MKRTSQNYVMTLQTDDPRYDEKLAQVRHQVKVMNGILAHEYGWMNNKYVKTENPRKYRVEVKNRKPKVKHEVVRYDGFVQKIGYTDGGSVIGGFANAGAVDIYIYER